MQTPPERYFDGNEQWESGPETVYTEAMSVYDVADIDLLMRYSRYMDKPSAVRMHELQDAMTESFDAFSDVMLQTLDWLEENEYEVAATLATILCTTSRNHVELINEYIDDDRENSDDEELRDEIEGVTGIFERYDREALAEAAIDHLKEIRDADMEAIERYVIIKSDSPSAQVKDKLITSTVDIAKIGAGALLALFVYDTVFRR